MKTVGRATVPDRRAARRRIAATLMSAALLLTGLTGAGLPGPEDVAPIEAESASATPDAAQTLMQTRAAETTPPAESNKQQETPAQTTAPAPKPADTTPAEKPSTPAETPTRSQSPAQTPPEQTPTQQAPSQEAPEPTEGVGPTEVVEDATEELEEELMEPLSVPPATGNNAVINVKVGGTRTDSTSVSNLSGVVLRLYNGTNSPNDPVNEPWATCTSDADGDCSFTIPGTQGGFFTPNGPNRDRQFWVVQESAPSGWYANSPLVTGTATNQNSTDYAFRTGSQLRAGNTYLSGTHFMQQGDNSTHRGSSGTWQNSLNNPKLAPTCQPGLNVALVMDLSGSVANAGAVGTLKESAKGMVSALSGTGTSMALYTFASTAPRNTGNTGRNWPLQSIDGNESTFNSRIDAYQAEGGTNWDRGMWQVAQSSNIYDLTIVITDGLPTFYGPGSSPAGPGSFTRFSEAEEAIFSANAIKATGSRLIAVGVGDGISGSPANLSAISGPSGVGGGTAPIDADYFQAGWTELEGVLETLALGATCQAEIQVNKLTQAQGETSPSNGGAGWEFGVTTTAGALTPGANQTTDSSGTVNYSVTFDTPNPGSIGLTIEELISAEQTADGWALEDITCTLDDSAVAVGSELAELTITSGSQVECTFLNIQTFPDTLVVKKNIASFADTADQFTFSVHQDDPNGALIGEPATTTGTEQGVQDEQVGPEDIVLGSAGGNYVLKETGATGSDTVLTNYVATYTCVDTNDSTWNQNGSLTLQDDGAYTADLGILPARASEETRREVECVITNTPKPQLTLIKVVDNPESSDLYAEPTDWTLHAEGNTDSISGVTGTAEVTNQFVEPDEYSLTETFTTSPDKSAGYQWTDLACVDGSNSPLPTDAFSTTKADDVVTAGSVTLGLQDDVTCTYTNTPLAGVALWQKVDEGENPLAGSEWTLVDPSGDEHVITDENNNGEFLVEELTWGEYTLKELRAPAGYLIDIQEHTFTINHENLEKDFGVALVNKLREGPALPLTGGLGRDFFTYLGLGVLLLGTATVSTVTLRNRRHAKA